MAGIAIIGAGLCGLSAAYHLEDAGNTDYLILERNEEVGGLTRTETYDGFSFDHSIHILYTSDANAADLILNRLLDGRVVRQARESWCYSAGTFTEYPYQANNYGLPAEIVTQNILGLIEAYYELPQDGRISHFEAWIYRTFGRGIAENFMIPYNQRQWAWDLKDMDYNWIAERVPMPKLREVLMGALRAPDRKYGPNREFWYPEEGGIEALVRGFMKQLPMERFLLNTAVVQVNPFEHELILSNGTRIRYERLISTTPMPALIRMMGHHAPAEIRQSALQLRHNIVHTVNIGLQGTGLGLPRRMHWVYFPEDSTIFHRLSFPHDFSRWMVPQGCCSIQAEISESDYRPHNRSDIIQQTLAGIVRVGILTEKEARCVSEGGRRRVAEVVTLDPAYVIYDLKHRENTNRIRAWLKSVSIETRGRFGEWEYLNMDHAILSGKRAARQDQSLV